MASPNSDRFQPKGILDRVRDLGRKPEFRENEERARRIDPFYFPRHPDSTPTREPLVLDITAPISLSPAASPTTPTANGSDPDISRWRQDTIKPPKQKNPNQTARVTLTAYTSEKHSFSFNPITFELVSHGQPLVVCRAEQSTSHGAELGKDKLMLHLASRVVTRGKHAQIWLEEDRVFVRDMGSSGGTYVNHNRLEAEPSTISRPIELNDNDIIRFGQDYAGNLSDKTYKSVAARVSIECLGPQITFHCRPKCHCAWRALLDSNGIYRLDRAVTGPRQIYDTLRTWMLVPGRPEHLQSWKNEDGKLLIDVIERIITSQPRFPPEEISLCQSWVRKIAREVGILPNSLVLSGVKQVSELAVSGGGFADIYQGIHEGIQVAIKVIRVFLTEDNKRQVHKEVSHEALFWKHLNHPHILPFLGVTEELFAPRLGLVSPWMSHGNISQHLEVNPHADRLSLLAQSAHGLRYLHSLNPALIHGDFKAANMLIDDDGRVRLTDFGLITISETQDFGTTIMRGDKGSMRWMAPELFQDGTKKSRSSDVYAFGMTILEIYTGRAPFTLDDYNNDIQVLMAVMRGCRPSRPTPESIVPNELWDLAVRCWAEDPRQRPLTNDVATELDSLHALNLSKGSGNGAMDEDSWTGSQSSTPPWPEPELPLRTSPSRFR